VVFSPTTIARLLEAVFPYGLGFSTLQGAVFESAPRLQRHDCTAQE
jgi:hypothetical protein